MPDYVTDPGLNKRKIFMLVQDLQPIYIYIYLLVLLLQLLCICSVFTLSRM